MVGGRWPLSLPGVAASFGRPGVHCTAEHGDLAGVVAVVGDDLAENRFQCPGYFLVAVVDGLDLATEFFA